MEPEVIEAISLREQRAGEKLLGFDQHRWVRLRVLLSELETQLRGAHDALRSMIDGRLLESQSDGRFPHPFPPDERERSRDARELLQRLDELVDYLEQGSAVRFPPIPGEDPQLALRITPDV